MHLISRFAICAAAVTALTVMAHALAFSKPGANEDDFRHDQLLCERASTYTVERKQFAARPPEPMKRNAVVHNKADFLHCMSDKGYRRDHNGFQTGRLWRL